MRQRRLTKRPTRYTPSNTVELSSPITEEQLVSFVSNPRNGFCSQDKNRVLVSLDYSGQETRIAAVISNDPAMVKAHLDPAKLKRPDGSEYVNPDADLHLRTTAIAIAPELVRGQPPDKWYDILTVVQPGARKKPRDYGKTVNFARVLAK